MGNKGWSVLFGVTMLACAIGFAVSPLMGWWMPEGVSAHAGAVDGLFYLIYAVTAVAFIITEVILVIFMWRYAKTPDGKPPIAPNAGFPTFLKPFESFLNDHHKIELAWTIVPSIVLLVIVFAQVNAWAEIKYATRNRNDGTKVDSARAQIAVSARQFEWRMRYPSAARFKGWMAEPAATRKDFESFGKIPHFDDVHVVNELHIWKDHPVVVHLTTRDVIHSFNLPNFRVKQDALPGKMIPVWFTPTKVNCKWDESRQRYIDGYDPAGKKEKDKEYTWDIACAELCGWGHYRMIGRVFVHKDQAEFLDWLQKAEAEGTRRN